MSWPPPPKTSKSDVNYVHAQTIFTHQIEEEMRASSLWFGNWGFLANKPPPAPRGFSTATAKYTYGGNKWSLEQKRVHDTSEEGLAAANAERSQRKTMTTLTWQSRPPNATKPCEAQGAYTGMTLVETDTAGVKNRESALLMRTHMFQSLGDACRTAGLDPVEKYRMPITASHEVGWRAKTAAPGTGRPGLELFGVAEHAKKQATQHMYKMQP